MQGFTLIEILIAWAIVSSVLFSIIALQTHNARHLYHLYLQNIAIMQLDNMLERLRANRSVFVRERELALWNAQNQQVLPNGAGSYHCAHHICIVRFHWIEEAPQQVALRSLI